MKITLYNDYHNSHVNLITKNGKLSASQCKRARRVLCGVAGCCCSDDLGIRGEQELNHIAVVYNSRTNEILGAYVYNGGE